MPKLSKKEVGKNVVEAFRSVGITTQAEMGEACHTYQETVSKWINGINYPTMDHMLDCSAKTRYEVQWLYTRAGRKLVETGTNSKDARLMATFHSLPKAEREWVERYIAEKSRK